MLTEQTYPRSDNPLLKSGLAHSQGGSSAGSGALYGLTKTQMALLTDLLDRYLQGLESGEPFDVELVATKHPDLVDIFQEYLDKLDALHCFVGDTTTGQILPFQSGMASAMQLGEFTILREIGRGGMGVVYEARQDSMQRQVAIKLLPMAALLDSRQIVRFHNEARAAGLLQHPQIVPVYSVGVEQGIHFYAMQLIDGQSLDHWLRPMDAHAPRGRVTDWRRVVGWTSQIADALHTAHEAGVIHRDVKPSNLMLDRNNKIWITDFGLARCQTELSLTHSGDLVGTMRYMSPEQSRGESAFVDGRSDIYSLAATAYEMLTLRPVHDGDNAADIAKQIDEHKLIPLRELRQDIPRDLATVIHKALAPQRDGRYETAKEFGEDLRRVLSGEPTIARPPTMLDRALRWATRHQRGVVVTLLFGLCALIGFAISTTKIAAEKRISDANLTRREFSERLARGAVDRLGSQMAELLAEIPAAETVRRRLLAETLEYYQQFAASAGDAPGLQEDLAITYGKIGALSNELGYAHGIEALRKSESLYATLASKRDHAAAQTAWATSLNNLATALHHAGQFEEAAGYFRKTIAIYDSLPLQRQSDATLGLATTLNNLGLLLADSELPVQAETAYARSLNLLESVQTPSTEARTQLAAVQTNLSGLLVERDSPRAVDLASQALEALATMLEADPGNHKLTTQTVVTLNTLGSAQSKSGQTNLAIGAFQQSVGICELLLQRWPNQSMCRRDLVLSLNHLGLAYSKLEQTSNARTTFERAIQAQRILTDTFAEDAECQSTLGGVLNNLGFVYQQLDRPDLAMACYQEAVVAQAKAVELAPGVGRYRAYLQQHRHNLSSFAWTEGTS
ncbi:MAG: protein kinase [Pirellulaceae bacterium]